MNPDPFTILAQNPMIAVIIASIMLLFKLVIDAVKGLLKVTPADKIAGSNEKLADTLNEVSTNLKLLNSEMRSHADISNMRQTQILDEIKAVRSKVFA